MTTQEPAAAPRGRRLLRTGLLVVAVLALVGGLTAGALAWRASGAVDRVDITARVGGAEPPPVTPSIPDHRVARERVQQVERIDGVLNVLLVGSDDRAVLTPEERVELGTGDAEGERTETIMLLRLDPDAEQVAALSIPRDLLVSRCDGSRGRINAAYAIGERSGSGGAACLVETVAALTGVEADHFAKVDFRGFLDIVDTLGGVTLHLDEPLRDEKAFLDLPAGCVTLDSADALAFVRARRLDSDFGRIARQHRFLRELAAELSSVGTLANVPRLFSLVDTVSGALELDEGLSLGKMQRIAATGRDLSPDALVSYTVPATPRSSDGTEFLVLQEEEAQRLFRAFETGAVLEGATDGAGSAPSAPEPDADAVGAVARDGGDVVRTPPPPTPEPAAPRTPAPIDASRFAGAEASDADC